MFTKVKCRSPQFGTWYLSGHHKGTRYRYLKSVTHLPDPTLSYFPLTLKRLEESDQNPEPDRNILRNIPKSQISIRMKIYLDIEVDF
jgi:hypothetical protein